MAGNKHNYMPLIGPRSGQHTESN